MGTALDGIDLSDSWVLGWKQTENTLEFEVEFSIWPKNPSYRPPRQDEHTCYLLGILRFNDVIEVRGLMSILEAPHTKDPDGSIDYGSIDEFEHDAEAILMSGDFGDVEIRCGTWAIELDTTKAEQDAAVQLPARRELKSE